MKTNRPVLIATLTFAACLGRPVQAEDTPPGAPGTPPAPAAPAKSAAQDAAPTAPAWMAAFVAGESKLGINEEDLEKVLQKQFKNHWREEILLKAKGRDKDMQKRVEAEWANIWNVVRLQTPEQIVAVPDFAMSKFEVTNAQWEAFMAFRKDTIEVSGKADDDTLEKIARKVWGLTENDMQSVQRGWQSILGMNEGVLQPILNPKKDVNWDPLKARAQQLQLAKGTKLTYFRYIPPPHWPGGVLLAHERNLPIRNVSYEQIMDFCFWAGVHLPTEAEWERAARGADGRLFPYGESWDPMKSIWGGFNKVTKEALEKSKKPGEAPPPVLPVPSPGGKPEDAPTDTPPLPIAVDGFPYGATPEGIQHLIGNVSEFVMEPCRSYPGTKANFNMSGLCFLAKGGNYQEHHEELLLATDRNYESSGGVIAASHALDGYGFRYATYPVAGADLAAPVAMVWNDPKEPSTYAFHWIPTPSWVAVGANMKEIEKAKVFKGFDPQSTGGVLMRQEAPGAADGVYITGPATGVAFMPVKGWPVEEVRSPSDVNKLSGNPERPLLIGLLVVSEGAAFEVQVPDGDKFKTVRVSPAGDESYWRDAYNRLRAKAPFGYMLVLEGNRVAVYSANDRVAAAAKNRGSALLGHLPDAAKVELVAPGDARPRGTREKDVATLTAIVNPLTAKGDLNPSAKRFAITIKVPMVAAGSTGTK